MNLDIKLPASWDEGENAILDASGKVRILFCWKNDADHVIIQTKLGKQIVELLNNGHSPVTDSDKHIVVESPNGGDEKVKKPHANKGKPAWWITKGVPHPRARK